MHCATHGLGAQQVPPAEAVQEWLKQAGHAGVSPPPAVSGFWQERLSGFGFGNLSHRGGIRRFP